MRHMKKAYLVPNNGKIFEGTRIGAEGEGLGELVFTTGMTGYLETLTDPSYAGQIIMHTFPLIGNYGVIPEDFEGASLAKGYVVRELCDTPSNFRSEYALDRFLKEHNIPGICGVDTRALTRMIREEGVMNALICDEVPADLSPIRDYAVRGGVAMASCKRAQVFPSSGKEKYRVALLDYGAKHHIVESLQERGCRVMVLPHDSTAEDVLALEPDGLMLSNGPGDPKENVFEIQQLKKLMGRLPIFGICLGHQILSLSYGAKTYKLKFGHRGGNHPIKNLSTDKIEITAQNHSYAVNLNSLQNAPLTATHINLLDNTVEGVECVHDRAFGVQDHPESAPGPQDSGYLFDRFITLMEEAKRHA